MIHLAIRGKVTLRDIKISNRIHEDDYTGAVRGIFCSINWQLHKSDPSSYPMFRDVVDHSDCPSGFTLDLKTVADMAREYDYKNIGKDDITVRSLEPSGFVFHESRCGSTLVANSFAALNPKGHRVYSESPPPVSIARACGMDGADCPEGRAAELLKDVLYLMGRTDNPEEVELFFKIQSIGSKYITTFMEAYPETPWIYVFREPVAVMMSQLAQGAKRANCVHQLKDVPERRISELEEDNKSLDSLTPIERCALHLSLLCESAIDGIDLSSNKGRAVNYENISEHLVDHIFPDHFKLVVSEEGRENVMEVGSRYSKGRGNRKKTWQDDSKTKEEKASPAVREAADYFLKDLYQQLLLDSENEESIDML